VNTGLLTGRSYLSRHLMLKAFFGALLYGFILVGQMYGQEVIVTRETKPQASKPATPTAKESPSEPEAPARTKPKSHEKKRASAEPTIEQMRMAGALAAERLNNPNASQTNRSSQSDSEAAPTPSPVVSETAKVARKETRSEQARVSRTPRSRTARPETTGVVRPTLMESGREQPSATPSPKRQTPAP
jgi:hypothetical protein